MLLLKILHSNRTKFILPLTGLLLFINSSIFGQNECSAQLQEARKYYDLGMIEDIPKLLAPCMEDGFTRMQKIEAYKLIILAYLFDDNQFEAEKTMVEFLKKFPEYEIIPNDPVEFVYLFESYRTTSVFSFGLTAGFNLTDPRIIEPYTVFDLSNVTLKNNMKPGFQIGAGVGGYLSKQILLNVEFYFSSAKYSFTDDLRIKLYDGPNAINTVTYTEKLYKIEIPVSVTYEFSIKKIHYYLRVGLSAARVTGVTGQPSLTYSDKLPPFTGENLDMSSYRKVMLYSGIIGVGMRYNVPRGVVMVDLRSGLGLNNIVLRDKRYDNHAVTDKFYYLDDDFSLNTLSLSVSYYFSFFKPKKQR
jgi:hypothetical protein